MIIFRGLLFFILIGVFETPIQPHEFIREDQHPLEVINQLTLLENEIIKSWETNYVGENEITFHISIFLMLFITIFSFNIYYCASVISCLYQGKFIPLDS
ncbi:hypothetical protein FQA39_LY10715 [Lamprigera yunnana]|nr:hypothetical protein FQA39_LY10715 [Lamprigera yunnana]